MHKRIAKLNKFYSSLNIIRGIKSRRKGANEGDENYIKNFIQNT
jgi:hypothetical protein